MTFPAFWGLVMTRYMHEYGATREQIAAVSVKNRRFGERNPLAQFRAPVTAGDVALSPLIADPIRRLDCCPATDGAAAVLLTGPGLAARCEHPRIRVAGSTLVSSSPRVSAHEDLTTHPGTIEAARRAYEMAGVEPADIDVAEVHDCFTIAEIVDSEDLGFFPKGKGALAAAEGRSDFEGAVVINPSGGLLSKGHPTGATGCGQIYEATLQLRGRHPNQVPNACLALTHNAGGASAAVTVNILERTS